MEVRVDLAQILISDTREQQIITLRERNGPRSLQIVIGGNEASAIHRRVRGETPARPLTHELLANIVEALGGELEKIIISDLKDDTYFATLVIRRGTELLEIDSRPSDAIALGVAGEVPLYVNDDVLRVASH
ncbi:MAG: bifunctional nuclease family protein [Phycisphaerales bacterium]|nr:bifunctional nuclease family protein [Phycisphaerales bacterium]